MENDLRAVLFHTQGMFGRGDDLDEIRRRLRCQPIVGIHLGKDTYPLTNRIRAVAFERLQEDIPRLR